MDPRNLSWVKPACSLIFPSTQFLSVGNPTLSLESYAPDVVEEETEEDLEDEINREEGGGTGAGGVEDCNSIGSLREGRRKEERGERLSLGRVPQRTRTRRSQSGDYIGLFPNPTRNLCT